MENPQDFKHFQCISSIKAKNKVTPFEIYEHTSYQSQKLLRKRKNRDEFNARQVPCCLRFTGSVHRLQRLRGREKECEFGFWKICGFGLGEQQCNKKSQKRFFCFSGFMVLLASRSGFQSLSVADVDVIRIGLKSFSTNWILKLWECRPATTTSNSNTKFNFEEKFLFFSLFFPIKKKKISLF